MAGYLIEKSLSVDNIFVFALIFSMFAIPARYQHRVLMYGIIGALALRAAFIVGGAALLDAFHLTIYLFGAVLLYTAFKVLRHGGAEVHPDKNLALRLIRRVVPSTSTLHGQKFLSAASTPEPASCSWPRPAHPHPERRHRRTTP